MFFDEANGKQRMKYDWSNGPLLFVWNATRIERRSRGSWWSSIPSCG
jgi:hypothetical protein